METQELFYAVGIAALVLVSAFVLFFFVAIYRLTKIAQAGLHLLRLTTQEMKGSLADVAKGISQAGLASLIFRAIRLLIRR
jgi:hypothetical protein